MNYCQNPFFWQRRVTREVKVGPVGVGGANPIRVQTMLISDTMNTDACVKEAIPIIEAGCEILRITAPSINDAKNLKNIVGELRKRGYNTPIVADIHFVPAAALEAAEWCEKVRINPGNYADRKKFAVREYTDDQYHEELERLEKAFSPLVLKCKQLGRAMGIGALLEDGIGDTVRVSLTEDSVHEIPVANELVKKYNAMKPEPCPVIHVREKRNLYSYFRREVPQQHIGALGLRVGKEHPP